MDKALNLTIEAFGDLSKNGPVSIRQEGNFFGAANLKEHVNKIRLNSEACSDGPMGGWGNSGGSCTSGPMGGWNN